MVFLHLKHSQTFVFLHFKQATCFGCHFMRMSNPSAWGSVSFNRWLDVYNELREGDTLKVMESHGFVSQAEEKETAEKEGLSGDQDK